MFKPYTAYTNDLSWQETINKLANSKAVDGVASFGSRTGNLQNELSDYDLLLLINHPPVEIFQMLTHIDRHLADVVFVRTETVDHILALKEPVLPTSPEGMFIHKMQHAQIHYDASGRLQNVQQVIKAKGDLTVFIQSTSTHNQYSAWFWHNHTLKHVYRTLKSPDPVYLMAVDMMLMTGL